MSVLIPDSRPGKDRLLSNPRFTWQFFGPERAREFSAFAVERAEPDNVIRIFVLGGSAAQGDPQPAFAMDRMLECMLQDRYPDARFEVINASITAVNSHVMLRVAQACARLQPDLFVIYMGNNEVVGPYGAGTAFSSVPKHRWTIGPELAWKRSRLGQFAATVQRRRAAKGRDRAWRGMELFLDFQVPADDPKLEAVYGHFEANLNDMIDLARRAGAGVVLSTVAVNLRDCAPFASRSADKRPAWEAAVARGVTHEELGRTEEALAAYREADAIGDGHAELAFRIARCHRVLGETKEARIEYGRARDLDTLRFRADSRINAIVRNVAGERKGDRFQWVDAEELLAAHSAQGLPGADLFYDHVHLRFEGNHLIAQAMVEAASALLPNVSSEREPLAANAVRDRLAFTGWDARRIATEMLGRLLSPPFTSQLDNEAQREILSAERDTLTTNGALDEWSQAREAMAAAANVSSANLLQHRRYASFLLSQGEDLEEAVRLLQSAIDRCPQSATDWILLGQVRGRLGRTEESLYALQQAVDLNPYSAANLSNLGVGLQMANRKAEAREMFEQALEMDPFEELAHFNLAVLLLSGRSVLPSAVETAELHYRTALEINPAYHEARHNLSRLYYRQAQGAVQAGQASRGIELLEQTLATDPTYAFPHFNLGMIFMDSPRDPKKAASHFRRFLAGVGDAHPQERATAEQALRKLKPQ